MVSELRYKVKTIKNLLIPMKDGVNLAGDLFLPEAEGEFPALLSFYPYHKDDLIYYGYMEDSILYFVERGYAHILVDFRGLGNSEGFNKEPIDPQEDQDGYDIVEWMAGQAWCNGNIGMWGLSYGAITSLKVGSINPPHLKCIVPIQGCIDIYETFVYPGGALNLFGSGAWASMMLAMNFLPPTYQDQEGRWARVWKEHLEKNEPWFLSFLDHPDYDEFWQRRRIRHDQIKVPTFIIAGWRDVVVGDTLEFFAGIEAPKKLLLGPWMHGNPHQSAIVPVDHLAEMARWFHYWLKGEETGIMKEPPVTLYVQGEETWRHEEEWPIQRTKHKALYLHPSNLLEESLPGDAIEADAYSYDPTVGIQSTLWDPLGLGIGMPQDQGPDDLLSLTYNTYPLEEGVEITGEPAVELNVSSSMDDVNFVVKICDVAPDGSSHLVTAGWLKGTHRNSHSHPEPLEPEQVYHLKLRLWPTSYLFKAGHRIRLSISLSDFPRLWPTPKGGIIQVFHSKNYPSHVILPAISSRETTVSQPSFSIPPPGIHPPSIISYHPELKVTRDLVNNTVCLKGGEDSVFKINQETTFSLNHHLETSVCTKDPSKAILQCKTIMEIHRPLNSDKVEAWAFVTTRQASMGVDIFIDNNPLFSKKWERILR